MTSLLVATGSGIHRIDPDGTTTVELPEPVTALAGGAALVGARRVVLRQAGGTWATAGDLDGHPDGTCVAAAPDGAILVGTREAHLLRLAAGTGGTGAGRAETLAGFEEAEGRDSWYTPWGGPPDTRWVSVTGDGTAYVNVHVGGILRSDDGGRRWNPTIDVDADVHQVLALSDEEVVAATAYGLARSRDRGATWTFLTEGLHADYSRAVAVAGEWLLVSSSTGPGTRQAAVYRRRLDAADDEPFERCRHGLPEWFTENVDTRCLVADGRRAALATGSGEVFVSEDEGSTWRQVAAGLGRISCLRFSY